MPTNPKAKPNGRRYGDAEKLAMLVRLVENGGSIRQTAAEFGVSDAQLYRWSRELQESADAETIRTALGLDRPKVQRGTDWGQLWGEVEARAIGRLHQRIDKATSIRDLAIVAGIAADKRMDHTQGRRGQPPANLTMTVNLGERLSDGDAARMLEHVAKRLRGEGAVAPDSYQVIPGMLVEPREDMPAVGGGQGYDAAAPGDALTPTGYLPPTLQSP